MTPVFQSKTFRQGRARVRPVQVRPAMSSAKTARSGRLLAVVEPPHQVVEIHVATAVRLGQLARPVPLCRGDAVLTVVYFLGRGSATMPAWQAGEYVAGSQRASRAYEIGALQARAHHQPVPVRALDRRVGGEASLVLLQVTSLEKLRSVRALSMSPYSRRRAWPAPHRAPS